MRILKTLEASPDGAELQRLYMENALLTGIVSEIQPVTIDEIEAFTLPASRHIFKNLQNDDPPAYTIGIEELKSVMQMLLSLRAAIACHRCHGSKTAEPGDGEIYICGICSGTGRRIRHRQRDD